MTAQEFKLAFSTCPNDTFIFHAMVKSLVDTAPYSFRPHLADVEELNNAAYDELHDITKLSFHAWLKLKDSYDLLDAGAALGFGCGPLLVAREEIQDLRNARIAVPGLNTTALMLLKLWRPDLRNIEVTRFDNILPGIASGIYEGGLIIHESRFVYRNYGFHKIIDLGEWWESKTGCPVPLGCIAIRKDLARHREAVEKIIAASVRHAFDHPQASREYIKYHAQELDDAVIEDHIRLYVNDFSLSLGEKGRQAVRKLEEMAACRGIV